MHTFRRLNVTCRPEARQRRWKHRRQRVMLPLDMTLLYTQTVEAQEREHVALFLEHLRSGTQMYSPIFPIRCNFGS